MNFIPSLLRSVALLGLLAVWLGSVAQAQPPKDDSVTPFTDKQKEMLDLMAKQMPKLKRLSEGLDKNNADLLKTSEFLKLPRNVQAYRDSCQKSVNRFRKNNDKHLAQLQEIYYEWIPYEREVMAVYTRYGELKAIDKIDANLKTFLVSHREFVLELERLRKKIQDIYNESDFLLTTKLN